MPLRLFGCIMIFVNWYNPYIPDFRFYPDARPLSTDINISMHPDYIYLNHLLVGVFCLVSTSNIFIGLIEFYPDITSVSMDTDIVDAP